VVAPVAVQLPVHITQEPLNSYSKFQFMESSNGSEILKIKGIVVRFVGDFIVEFDVIASFIVESFKNAQLKTLLLALAILS
jgi:hypothetical protein